VWRTKAVTCLAILSPLQFNRVIIDIHDGRNAKRNYEIEGH
jgi:hypothetical protein